MGLDITAYKNLKKVENPEINEWGELGNWETQWLTPDASIEWAEKHFPGRSKGVELNTVYEYEERLGFPAGSYSGYNYWRKQLNTFKGDVAFQELIDFADNEGVIGSVVSKKLAEDFKTYVDEADAFSKTIPNDEGEWWLKKYKLWQKAFEMAADNGAVDFH